MAYNTLRRRIASVLAAEDHEPGGRLERQADLATKLESTYSFEDDGNSLKMCKDWVELKNRLMVAEERLLGSQRVLRQVLLTLGGPVVEARPPKFSEVRDQITRLIDLPDAQVAHPCDTPAVEAEPRDWGADVGDANEAGCTAPLNEQADGFRGPQPEETSAQQSRA